MQPKSVRPILIMALLLITGCALTPEKQLMPSDIDDRTITSKIKASYAQNEELDQSNITVETLYGVVLLSGVIKYPQQKTTANMLAEQVNGVKAVHNHIHLESQFEKSRTDTGSRMRSSFEL